MMILDRAAADGPAHDPVERPDSVTMSGFFRVFKKPRIEKAAHRMASGLYRVKNVNGMKSPSHSR
jgi:hypothetical protein